MKLINNSNFLLDSYTALNQDGIEYETILLRARYQLVPSKNKDLDWSLLADKDQGEWFKEAVHYEDDPKAAIRFEADHVHFKLTSDVIINAMAYAPEGKARQEWQVGVEVDKHKVLLKVFGPRYWHFLNNHWQLSEPEACLQVPLRYENAYGGSASNTQKYGLANNNPIGKGIIDLKESQQHFPAHQIETIDRIITDINTPHYPAGFGFISKDWEPRKSMLATLTQDVDGLPPLTKAGVAHQAANYHGMVMSSYLKGQEVITLGHLFPGKSLQRLQLPGLQVSFRSQLFAEKQHSGFLPLETVVIDIAADNPAEHRVYLYWRMIHGQASAIESVEVSIKEML